MKRTISSIPKAIDIVKRGGRRPSEAFNPEKLHASIRAALLSTKTPVGEANMTALAVTDTVIIWLTDRSEVTSADLRRVASDRLTVYHPEAAYIYKHHQLVL